MVDWKCVLSQFDRIFTCILIDKKHLYRAARNALCGYNHPWCDFNYRHALTQKPRVIWSISHSWSQYFVFSQRSMAWRTSEICFSLYLPNSLHSKVHFAWLMFIKLYIWWTTTYYWTNGIGPCGWKLRLHGLASPSITRDKNREDRRVLWVLWLKHIYQ